MNKLDLSPDLIKSDTLPSAWRKVIERLKGKEELYNVIIHIKNPKKELPNELKKFKDDIAQWVKELLKPELDSKILPFTHGQRIFRWGGKKDQFADYIIPLLQKYPKTRRAVITIRDPFLDCKIHKHIPAPQLIQFIRDKQLIHITAYYRAQEMYLFWVINAFELIDLQHMACEIINEGTKPGSVTTISFIAYLKPSDFPRISIEMFELSALSQCELKEFLNLALIKKKRDKIDGLIQSLTADMQKLEGKTSLETGGFKVFKDFVQTHSLEIGDFVSRPLVVKINEVLNSFSILRTYLRKEIGSEVRKEKIKTYQDRMKELISIVKTLLCPRVFVASTNYGLQDIRARLPIFMYEIGFVPIYFESEDFDIKNGHSHDVCLDAVKNCDFFLLIIGPRYGGTYSGSKYPEMKELSITHAETRLAVKLNKRIYACIRQNISDERKTVKDNIGNGRQIKPSFATIEVYKFIDEIQQGWGNEQGKKINAWIDTFNRITDLETTVKKRLERYFSSRDSER